MAFDITDTLISIATVLIFSQITIAELVVKPTDTEALVGDLTYFNCSTSVVSQAAQWFHSPLGVTGDREIVYGYSQFYGIYKDRFAIEVNEAAGTYNLVIRSVQVQDAGRYECQDDVGRGEKASALLIVLDQSPLCQSNDKANEVIGSNGCDIPVGELQFTCGATYHGDAAPVLKWFQDGSDQPLVDSPSSSGSHSQSNLTLKADSIKDGSSFHCRTTRSKTTSYSCTSGPVKIIGSHGQTCPSTKPYVDAILVICLFMIPIITAASVVGGIYLENRFKIFGRLVKRKDKVPLPVEAELVTEEDVAQKTDVTKDVERLVLLENNVKTQEQQLQQYELLKMKTLELAKSSDEDKRKIVKLEQIARHEKRKLEEEKVKWEEEKRELEERLHPSAIANYSDKPKLVSIIDIKALKPDSKKETKPIVGMTILRNKLFVVTEKSSEIEVYDSITFKTEPRWHIAELSNPLDIASCRTMNCLYLFNGEPINEILRVDSYKRELKKHWSIEEDLGHLSVTREGNVVVSLFNGNKIIEYSSDGQLIRTVRLSPADNISHPWHAIKTTSMHFIFSHGVGDDPLQRVCVAKADGKIVKSFGGKKGSDIKEEQMNRPVHLLENSSRNVLVADMKNKRVLLLSPALEYKRILLSAADTGKLRFPMRLCLDEERGILFVGDNNYKEGVCTYDSGRILIFNCKI